MEATKIKTEDEKTSAKQGATAVKERPAPNGNGKEREKDKMPVKVFTAWCKGCGICVAYCPKKVLAMDESIQKPVVVNPDACIQCGLCELRCPDIAITRTGKGKTNGTK